MIVCEKIPPEAKQIGAIAVGRYAIFCKGLIKAGTVCTILYKKDKRNGIPFCGYVAIKKEKIYYCLYGFINDPSIYLNNDDLDTRVKKNSIESAINQQRLSYGKNK